MSCATAIAHRATRRARLAIPAIAALMVALTATVSTPAPVAAGGYAPRVVIVVGPSGGSTDLYLGRARSYATQARGYGASVTEIYTPHATWSRVLAAAQGANVFIYLGHGNGWPSPYPPFQGSTKDGLGLNPTDGSGRSSPVKYYGEGEIAAHVRFAPGAIVLLNHLCYASGNGEEGAAEPSWDTARKRVDNYAAGFLRARATAVLADAHSSLANELAYLFGRARPVLDAWRADADARGHEQTSNSTRSPGYQVHVDPDTTRTGFYRSLVTKAAVSTAWIRTSAFGGVISTATALRSGASADASSVAALAAGARLWVTGPMRTDARGRTWAPIVTSQGATGFVAAWFAGYRGSAVPRTDVILRSSPTLTGSKVTTVRHGTRVTVLRSTRDRAQRLWLNVRTSSGRTGWLAGWLTQP